MTGDKSGSPPCGIYVRIDDYSDMTDVITKLRQMALVINRASGYEKNMCVVELAFDKDATEQMKDLITIIQAEGMVAIITGGWLDGADGALLADHKVIEETRAALGEEAIIGLICQTRAQGEIAIEKRVDYAVLPADPAMLGWWRSKTDKLSLASGKGITNSNCGNLARAGADLVDVTEYVFNHEKGVMQGTVNILHALDMAAQPPGALN